MQSGLSTRFDIKGFPSLKFFREGEIRNFNGARTVDALVAFGKEMNAPPVTVITQEEEFDALVGKYPVSVVFFGGKSGVEKRLFSSLAYRLQGSVKFFSVAQSSASVLARAGVTEDETPLVLLVTKHADTSDALNRFSGPWVDEELRSFILSRRLPLVTELDQNTFDDVTTSGKRIVYAILNSKQPASSEAFVEPLYRLAQSAAFRDEFVFARLDGIKYHKYVSQFGVTVGEHGSDVSQLPTVVVIDKDMDYYYAPRPRGSAEHPVTHPIGGASEIENFLTEVVRGDIGLTGTTPWYNPSRYVKLLEKSLSTLPVWQVAVLSVVVMLGVVTAMFFCCFSGLDGAEDLALEAAEMQAAIAERKKGKKGKKSIKESAADSVESAPSEEAAQPASPSGVRARKSKKEAQ